MLFEPDGVCEVVGVFRSAEELEAAIDLLLSSGFDRAQLSLLASERAIAGKLNHHFGSVAELARPALPKTELTSGKLFRILSCVCSTSAALVIDMPGRDAGM